MKPRPTGNELFDIFWEAYPYRINGTGAMEKKRKGPALKWFEKESPSEEKVYDMVAWIKLDKENREASDTANHFYSAPPDAIVWLNQKRWMDEIGVEVTKTTRREAHRSKAVYANNAKEKIANWKNRIQDWTDEQLRASKPFQAAWKYPEFRKWVKEQRAGRKPEKITPKPLASRDLTVNVAVKKISPAADLPPPKTEINPLVEKFIKDYDLF